jgi:multidrug resistance efflux pump
MKEHLRQMRYQLIPVLVFLCGIYSVLVLWGKHVERPNGIGAVKAVRIDIISPVDGILVELPERNGKGQLDMFDSVSAGEVICKFDDTMVNATIKTINAEIKQLQLQLTATDAEMKLQFADRRSDKSDRRQDLLDDARRIAVDLEGMKLDVADRTIELESNRIALKRRAETLAIVKKLVEQKLDTPYKLSDTQLQHDVLEREIVEQEKALIEAKALSVQAQARMDKFAKMVREEDALREAQGASEFHAASIQKEIDIFLKPIEAAVAIQNARLEEALLQLKALEIRVPSSLVLKPQTTADVGAQHGRIVEVYFRPGQAVRAGDVIMRIANPDSTYIVSYVRQSSAVELKVDVPVGVQPRTVAFRGAKPQNAKINGVGPQIEAVPTRQLRDPRVPEWGRPVKISVPEGMILTPGELVDITYKFVDS